MWVKNILRRIKALFGTAKNKASIPAYNEAELTSVVNEPVSNYGAEKTKTLETATTLNGAFASFREDWEAPEMDVYDINYK